MHPSITSRSRDIAEIRAILERALVLQVITLNGVEVDVVCLGETNGNTKMFNATWDASDPVSGEGEVSLAQLMEIIRGKVGQ